MTKLTVLIMPVLLICLQASAFTLEEAIATAMEQRGDVAAARNEVESTRWSRNAAHTWFLPQVDFSLSYQKSHDIQEMTIPGMGSIPMGSEWSSRYGITASLPIVLQGPVGASMTSTALNLSEITLSGAEQDAVSNVISSFYGVLMAEMMSDVTTEAMNIAREGFVLAEQRFEVGTISRFELLQSQVAYENRRPDSIAAVAGVENSRAAFAVSMGFNQSHTALIEGELTDPFPVPLPDSFEEAQLIMGQNSTTLASAEEIRKLADAQVDLSAASFAPQLIFSTSYGFQAGVDDIWQINSDDYSRSWSTSAVVQIPIFHGINDFSNYQSARADRLASHARASDMENYTSLQLTATWNSLHQARETVGAAESTVQQAIEGSEIARVSYEAGIITRLDMDGAFLALTQARTNYASALYSLKTAETGLARALGILSLDLELKEINQ
ncbi:MAG: TolC family protein [Candidatus Sabulitectum sp.]|nr:TolC family protein [Candidatus Sabulitectum sp.]